MIRFAGTADAVSRTTKKLKKVALVAAYFRTLQDQDLKAAAVFFTGRAFPLHDARTLSVGWAALEKAIERISGASDEAMHKAYLARGDLGEVAELVLPARDASVLSPAQLLGRLENVACVEGSNDKIDALTQLLGLLKPAEAKYLIKIITGNLRIGLKESLVEEAIAEAFGTPVDSVRRTNMALGDIGETAVLARAGKAGDGALRLFRPLKFMLATPAEGEEEVFENFSGPFYIEDKYDGIRGQLHIDGSRAALFSRTLDDISHQFPEIIGAASGMGVRLIVDGEVVGFKEGQVLSFAQFQKRFGRKKPSPALLAGTPAAYMIFDLLYLDGETLTDESLSKRKQLLQDLPWPIPLFIASFKLVRQPSSLTPFFEEARARQNEGVMLKDAGSAYIPGKRGKDWMKWKKALATLDVVVTGVEFGHGRRRDVLSDYTFAVQHEGQLLNIGKAYSGLTDREILEMTEFFKQHTIQDFGRFRLVEPAVVVEVAFNNIQKSSRHQSGFALRFPRIVRLRPDKMVSEIDTLETVARLYERSQRSV